MVGGRFLLFFLGGRLEVGIRRNKMGVPRCQTDSGDGGGFITVTHPCYDLQEQAEVVPYLISRDAGCTHFA
jgi:hypothetical protein